MKTSDVVLLVIGILVAVTTLVRMMLARRDRLVAEVQKQLGDRRQGSERWRDDHPGASSEAA